MFIVIFPKIPPLYPRLQTCNFPFSTRILSSSSALPNPNPSSLTSPSYPSSHPISDFLPLPAKSPPYPWFSNFLVSLSKFSFPFSLTFFLPVVPNSRLDLWIRASWFLFYRFWGRFSSHFHVFSASEDVIFDLELRFPRVKVFLFPHKNFILFFKEMYFLVIIFCLGSCFVFSRCFSRWVWFGFWSC